MTVRILAGLLICLSATAAEILWEQGALRVVSGDWATRVTRGIEAVPKPTEVTDAQTAALIEACGAENTGVWGGFLGQGLRRYGWAQREQEIAGGVFLKLRMYVRGEEPLLAVAEQVTVDGTISNRTTLSLSDGAVTSERREVPGTPDRTVYASLLSPESFVANQEHFQKQLFESILDLARPGMERVRQAYEAGKPALAGSELAEYYRRKTSPAKLIRKPIVQPEALTDPAGDQICAHVFDLWGKKIEMGASIEWNRHNEDAGVAEWLWTFNGHRHFVNLLDAYLKTANEKYAEEFTNQITDFILQNPAPPYLLTRVATWRSLEAGTRSLETWPAAFYGFLSSPRFTPQAIQLVLGSLWSHGRFIQEHPAGLRRPSNWSIVDSSGLVGVSMYFPEFRDAPLWRETGFGRLVGQMQLQVYPDGAQYELAPSYHMMCLSRFQQVLDLAGQTGFELDPSFARGVESMYEYLMWLVEPNGSVPRLGDSYPNSVKGLLKTAARQFKRADMQYVATGGVEGTPPVETSHMTAFAGFGVMRSDWTPDALYLCFDGGPLGTGHAHEDKLAVVLSAYGREFLVDAGPYMYTRDKWRTYCVSSAAHSTLLVDGMGQTRLDGHLEETAADTPKLLWVSDKNHDYAAAAYTAGYGRDRVAVTHRRHVVFKKPEYWVIADEIAGSGTHEIESLFHFAPDLEAIADSGLSVWTQNATGPNLFIQVAAQEGLGLSVVRGQEEPTIQGWCAPGGHDLRQASVASYRIKASLPLTLVYVLYPVASGAAPRHEVIASRPGEGLLEVTVGSGGGVPDVIRIHVNDGRVECGTGKDTAWHGHSQNGLGEDR